MRTDAAFDRLLWTIVLAVAVALVVFNFAEGPLTSSDGSAVAMAHPLTLWVAGGEAAGETELLARQAAACWQRGGLQTKVGVLPGSSVEAVDGFLRRTRGAGNDLLMLSGDILSEVAREARQPPGSQARERADTAARLLLRATPVALLGNDPVSLAVRSDSPVHLTADLLALIGTGARHPLLGVADEAWLVGSLASLAQSAGVRGSMPFSAYRSSREAVVSLDSGEVDAILAPHSALATDLRRDRLRALDWTSSTSASRQGWVAILAPSDLQPDTVAALRRQASRLCAGDGWRRRLEHDGIHPASAPPRSLTSLIRSGLSEANRLQGLAARVVRDY